MKSIFKYFLISTLLITLTSCQNNETVSQTDKEAFDVVEVDQINHNNLSDFDLIFLQTNTEKTNKVYSPISIKYALGMLQEGANGESSKQIEDVLGSYHFKQYQNSNNVSFANALFVNEKHNVIKDSYKQALQNKFNAEVEVGSFKTPDLVNNWVSDNTFNLINNVVEDISKDDFVLVNALAIDMDWKKVINPIENSYLVTYPHISFINYVDSLNGGGYHYFTFTNDESKNIDGLKIAATINKYDIVDILGEEKIRQEVGAAYDKWISEGACGRDDYESTQEYLDHYIKEIDSGYGHLSTSTDFKFYDDDTVRMFAKDLKEYDGLELQYIGIMPKSMSLQEFVAGTNAEEINTLISNLKEITFDEFEMGYITTITGGIPLFKYDFELNLIEELQKIGIIDVFDTTKADLSNLSEQKEVIDSATHKTTIEFSNEGITAAAAATLGGLGADSCFFEYKYEPEVIEIDLSFDQPFLYLIRDKNSNEVWFIGEVYQPSEVGYE